MITSIKLTVYFEGPFWVGIFEADDKEYKVSKCTFGAEPKDVEVYEFILRRFYKLRFFKEELFEVKNIHKKVNPKKEQRKIRRQLENKGVGTKAQNAIKKQHEEDKTNNKKRAKEKREDDQKRKYKLKKSKRKEKHKGH